MVSIESEVILKLLALYLGNVLVIAIPMALFEIWLERFKSGWGGEFYNPFWGKKFQIKILNIGFEKAYVSTYHLVMFGVILIGILATEWLFLSFATHSGWIVGILGTKVFAPVFFAAVWLGVSTLEDYLWFAFNTWFHLRFPFALHKLYLRGMKWHTKWVQVSKRISLPRFYLTTPAIVIALLFVQRIVIWFLG